MSDRDKNITPYFYRGDKITLRPIEREDYTERMHKWANDPEFNKYLSHGIRPTTREAMERLYEDLSKKDGKMF